MDERLNREAKRHVELLLELEEVELDEEEVLAARAATVSQRGSSSTVNDGRELKRILQISSDGECWM